MRLARVPRHFKILLLGFLSLIPLYIYIGYVMPCSSMFCGYIRYQMVIMVLCLYLGFTILSTIIYTIQKIRGKTTGIGTYILSVIIVISIPVLLYLSTPMRDQYREYKDNQNFQKQHCLNKNGSNTVELDGIVKKFECKNGEINGNLIEYKDGRLIAEINYVDGVIDGVSIRFDENTSTESYHIINGKNYLYNNEIYARYHEYPFTSVFYLGDNSIARRQQELCTKSDYSNSKSYRFTCVGNKVNGKFLKFDYMGELAEEYNFNNGLLDGPTIFYRDGKIYKYISFKNGIRHGVVYSLDETYPYKGQYINGRQEGLFTTKREIVRFENGRIVEILPTKYNE